MLYTRIVRQVGVAGVPQEQEQVLPSVRLLALPKFRGALQSVDPRVGVKCVIVHELGVG